MLRNAPIRQQICEARAAVSQNTLRLSWRTIEGLFPHLMQDGDCLLWSELNNICAGIEREAFEVSARL